jgi:hypothetical protein
MGFPRQHRRDCGRLRGMEKEKPERRRCAECRTLLRDLALLLAMGAAPAVAVLLALGHG